MTIVTPLSSWRLHRYLSKVPYVYANRRFVTLSSRGQYHWSFSWVRYTTTLILSNPIFLPTAYSPALICFGRERGWWITCNYPTVLKEKTYRNRKSTTCATCWQKFVLHEEKRRTGSDSGRTNATKTVSDVFRHRSGTGKLYCCKRFDVESERVKQIPFSLYCLLCIRENSP
jgi:hypothetical protein